MTKNSAEMVLIQRISNAFENWIKPITQFLIYLRVPVAIAFVSFLFFSQIDQTVEVYRAIALDILDRPSSTLLQASLSTAFVFLLSLSIWYAARLLEIWYQEYTREDLPAESPKSKLNAQDKAKLLYTWAPRFLGVIPLLSVALGLWTAHETLQNSSSKAPIIFLILWMFFVLILTVILLFILFARTWFVNRIKYLKSFGIGESNKNTGLFGQDFENFFVNLALFIFNLLSFPLLVAATSSRVSVGILAAFVLLVILNTLLISWNSDPQKRRKIIFLWVLSFILSAVFGLTLPATLIPGLIGSVSVVAIAFSIFVIIFSTINNWGQQTKIPGITLLIGLVIFSSLFNLNDNHRFRQFSRSEPQKLPTLDASFRQWLASRRDRDQFSGRPYPVYIIAAQGGGIYAAYHSATALAKLTEYFPGFPKHVFAISGVSGGSLGSAVYSGLVKEAGVGGQSLNDMASQLFSSDLLAPLLTMGLFPDMVQRVIPLPIYDWDRATGLEVAFEQAWDRLVLPNSQNPLRQSFYQFWHPEASAPALVLNTTVVETGDRKVISPFQIPLPSKQDIVLNEPSLDLKLSTAAVLSARFPYFTPVGWYQRSSDQSKLRLVDGGYFDNSGVPTALDIGRSLQQIEGYGKTFEIVYISLIDQHVNSDKTEIKSAGLNEILSPIRALFSARESRSRSAVELSTFTVNEGIDDPLQYKFRTLFLKKSEEGISLPLGWLISDRSRQLIDRQTPDPRDPAHPCRITDFRNSFENGNIGSDVINHNLCVAKSIGDDLKAL
jgi:hypothetical protein